MTRRYLASVARRKRRGPRGQSLVEPADPSLERQDLPPREAEFALAFN